MNEIETYMRVKAALARAETLGIRVRIRSEGVRIGTYEFPCITANEIHHYLNGTEDGKRKLQKETES